jgi:hypothetical protein
LVDDIVVTARRRSETLVSVPVVVNVVTAETLERNRADDLSRIGELTPTVVVGAYKSNGGGSVAIRGISSPANQTGFEQAVSVAIDGIQTSDGRITQMGFFDLQQVEVMTGPQALFVGTTWGLPKEARIFPYTVMAVLAVLGVAVAAIELRRREAAAPVAKGAGLLVAASLGFVALFWLAGFQVASLAFLFFTMWRLGVRPVLAAMIAVGTTAGLHVMFKTLLGVPL